MNKLLLFTVLGLAFISLQSCLKDECEATRTFIAYEPIYKTLDQIRVPIVAGEKRKLENPGKIYFYDNFIFVNELYEGVHLIDNSNPQAPVITAFINIPGNVDIAVVDNILYADNYIDLVAIDISAPTSPKLAYREENVFSRFTFDTQRGYLVDFLPTTQKEEIACSDPRFGTNNFWNNGWWFLSDSFRGETFNGANIRNNTSGGNTGAKAGGVGGSFARFGIASQYLYIVDQFDLRVFDIQKPSNP
ncbi:MAG: hypothetical protein HC892_01920 [Saprospiraceae bacterium]|nr:hypothetical protein [Saprospiraceae bacterium]